MGQYITSRQADQLSKACRVIGYAQQAFRRAGSGLIFRISEPCAGVSKLAGNPFPWVEGGDDENEMREASAYCQEKAAHRPGTLDELRQRRRLRV